jgi:hypothetical protein
MLTLSALEPIGGNANRIWKLKFTQPEIHHKFVDGFNKASKQLSKNTTSSMKLFVLFPFRPSNLAESDSSTPMSHGSTSSEKSNVSMLNLSLDRCFCFVV